MVVSILLLLAPWIFGFAAEDNAKVFYIGSGILIFIVYLTTAYKAAEADPASHTRTA